MLKNLLESDICSLLVVEIEKEHDTANGIFDPVEIKKEPIFKKLISPIARPKFSTKEKNDSGFLL